MSLFIFVKQKVNTMNKSVSPRLTPQMLEDIKTNPFFEEKRQRAIKAIQQIIQCNPDLFKK